MNYIVMMQFSRDNNNLYVSYKENEETLIFNALEDAKSKKNELEAIDFEKMYYIQDYE
jgi:hypothetical protein